MAIDANGTGRGRLTRVVLRNYRSIAACDVRLGPLTFLVGPNGSGKSNFLDALRFVTDSVRASLDHAIRERGGIAEVRRRSSGHPTHFGIRLEFLLAGGVAGWFAFDVGAREGGEFVVKREECRLPGAQYRVVEGRVVVEPHALAPPASPDRLYLLNAAGLPWFKPVLELLERMGFYNPNPARMRMPQPPDNAEMLARDGANLASMLDKLQRAESTAVVARIHEYLSRIVPGIESVGAVQLGPYETLEFRQRVGGAAAPWRFHALHMSDGTLRALAILVALFQAQASGRIPLVAIEEPETAVHPAAAALLRDALRDGSRATQVLVTSHSPDLLDDESVGDGELLAVTNEDGDTRIAPLDPVGRAALADRLYTAGELLRAQQLVPDPAALPDPDQLKLFEDAGP